jgi:pilus assembly protein Flp/PilA
VGKKAEDSQYALVQRQVGAARSCIIYVRKEDTMNFWQWLLSRRLHTASNDDGQGLVEYALILVLVAVVVIAILVVLGPAIYDVYENIVESL